MGDLVRYSLYVTFEAIYDRLARLERYGGTRWGPDAIFHAGVESRKSGDRYFWDGLKRGMPGHRPFAVFQATLGGAGVYEDERGAISQTPGTAFLALVPSAHRYYLPEKPGGRWTFFWAVIRHPYVVDRLIHRRESFPASFHVPPESLLLARASALCVGGFRDRFDEELALFSLLTEYERHVEGVLRGGAGRDPLEEAVRAFALLHVHRPIDVSEVARRHGMSRSRFSHRFKALTGESPARFLLGIRLEEAARRLAHTDETLAAISDATGFADANHLCKAFRRRFHTSPGAFRRQLR